MINIKDALYNILHSRYGRDVRQSIHDGIYQINENANEAVQTAKAMGVGTDISSSTSSSTGYVAGNLYLNNSTWDLWQCIGTDSWVNKGNIKGATGVKGADGINYYIHIRYSDKYDGTGFTASPTASSEYMGVYYGTSQTAPTNKQDYQWTSYVGASGTSAYVHIMYSENADGTDFVSIPTPLCKYIGFYSGPLSSPPANKSYYTWSEYVGKSGSGSGDMTEAEYAPSGVYGKVDHAIKADNVGNADTSLLEKLSDNSGNLNYNGNALMLEAAQFANQAKLGEFEVNQIGNNVKELALHSNITTKLSKVDTTDNLSVELAKKIDKPASATNGQVLTYNGTSNEWEAQDSKGGSITEPTDLEKGIIGGDEWVSGGNYTIGESVVIDENKLYLLVGDGGSITKPSTDTTHSIWEETSISALNSKVSGFLQLEEIYNNKTISFPQDGNARVIDVNLLESVQKYKFVICVLSVNGSDNYSYCYLGKTHANGVNFIGGNGGTYYRHDNISINTKISIVCYSYYTNHTINGILLYGIK